MPKTTSVTPGSHNSITFFPDDYDVTSGNSGLVFRARRATTLTVGHPPPPAQQANEPFTLKEGDTFTLLTADGPISILAYQEVRIDQESAR